MICRTVYFISVFIASIVVVSVHRFNPQLYISETIDECYVIFAGRQGHALKKKKFTNDNLFSKDYNEI